MTVPEARRRGGPFVKGAFLCERVLEEKDNANSYIRVIDQVTLSAEYRPPRDVSPEQRPPPLPESVPEFQWDVVLVLMLVAGDAVGRSEMRLSIEPPDGLVREVAGPFDVHFQRPSGSVNVHTKAQLGLRHEGVYWIHVQVDGHVLTQVPFEVIYRRRPPGSS